MPIRIVHTADNHIGLPFRQYSDDLRSTLADERCAALTRLVEAANERRADFFVVAGDLFDSTRVTAGDIKRTVEILGGFAGVAVLVLPGNHDYLSGPETEVWKRFRTAAEGVGVIHLLTAPSVQSYEVGGQKVHFFPCPCPSKTGTEPTIGWVAEAAAAHPDGLRIGIAHGNVTGLGLDAEGHYFTMEPAALEQAGVATWLLGHIHVPFPAAPAGERSPYFMAGTHTPDSIRCGHAGSAWLIECDEAHVTRFERLAPGTLRFLRLKRQLTSADDVGALIRECAALDASRIVLDLQLSGRLASAERAELDAAIERIRENFLELTQDTAIHQRIDAAEIQARHPEGGLAHRLLTALLEDADHPDAATLAHELIQEVKGG